MNHIAKIFLFYCKKYPKYFIMLSLSIIVQAIGNSLSVFAIAPVTDLLLKVEAENFSEVTAFLISSAPFELDPLFIAFSFFIASMLFAAFFSWLSQHFVLLIKFKLVKNILSNTIQSFFKARYTFFSEANRGEILNSFQKDSDRVGDAIGHFATLFANTFQGLIFLILPFYISIKLTIMFIAFAVLTYLPFLLAQKFITSLGKQNTLTANNVAGFLNETLSLSKVILVFAKQGQVNQVFNNLYGDHADVAVKFKSLVFAISTFFVPLGMGCAILTMYIGLNQGETLTSMSMILFSFFRLMPVVGSFLTNYNSVIGSIPSFNQIESLTLQAGLYEEQSGSKEFQKLVTEIELKNISFAYPDKNNVLDEVSIKIKRGSRTAIIGESGSGKSTLMDILMGLYLPSSGNFLLDGVAIDQYDINSYRQKVGYVPQESNLLDATIRQNLLWANPNASETELTHSLSMANCDRFISLMPNGIDTDVGYLGNKLSGGQKQRLALARALIIQPEIIFLDEATSSLDIDSEQAIKDAIASLPPAITVVIIAHRLSAIDSCNYYYKIQDGRVEKDGSI